jgi:hypothetical protein
MNKAAGLFFANWQATCVLMKTHGHENKINVSKKGE